VSELDAPSRDARNAPDVVVFGSVMVPSAQASALERLADAATLEAPPPTRRMLVIVNPYATTMSVRLRQLVVYALQGRFDVEAVDTQRKGHAIELCQAAAEEGYDVVVAFGGDGTVNEAANGLAGTPTALTCLPGGSNNVVAKLLGIPTDVVDATEHLLELADRWEPRRVDLGVVNERMFTFAAGMGLDAAVVERVDSHPHLKARFGPWYFVEAAVSTFLRSYVVNPPRLEVEVDGRTIGGVSVFIQNAERYTYFKDRPVELVEGARFDSGDLAGVVLTRARPYDVPTVTFRALSGAARIAKHKGIAGFVGAKEIAVRSTDGRTIPVHVDGDHILDTLEARFSIAPSALQVVS
jgi:diacylglycerol kinase family enzyme